MRWSVRLGVVFLAVSCRKSEVENVAPTAQIATPAAGESFDVGEPIAFSGTVFDAEDAEDALAIGWSSDVDGLLSEDGADATGLVAFTSANLSAGEHVITLSVTDSGALVSTATVAISLLESSAAPTLVIVAPEPDTEIVEGDSFLFEATVSDPEDAAEDLIVEFESDLDGTVCTPEVTTDGAASCEATLTAGHHLLTFSVLDTDDHLVSATVYFDVLSPDAIDDDGDGVSEDEGDCDDTDAAVSPSATEITGDAIDSDCDGREVCFLDTDGDKVGSAATTVSADVDCADFSESTSGDDCDDKNGAINPGEPEIPGDGTDQNCDGIDGCFEDLDGDGFGSLNTVASSDTDCSDPGESDFDTDCDDAEIDIHPGAPEGAGDGVDSDCDAKETCFVDSDEDGARTTATVIGVDLLCSTADGEANLTAALDCADVDAAVHPGATELAGDAVDQDCDTTELCFVDSDHDGARTTATVASSDLLCATNAGEAAASAVIDCADTDAAVNPSATERPGDGVDQNCDSAELCYVDADQDGARTAATVASPDATCAASSGEALASALIDCADGNGAIAPGATELPGDGIDQDCSPAELCYVDGDQDGARTGATVASSDATCAKADGEALASAAIDCLDTDVAVNPSASEVTGDGKDQNCDGAEVCYVDSDKDGARTASTVNSPDVSCAASAGEALASAPLDCVDGDPAVFPAASEVAGDGNDQNCDGAEVCYVDFDKDGARTAATVNSPDLVCALSSGEALSTAALDCADTDAAVNPAASELTGDGKDQNCDGAEVCYVDSDKDGARTAATVNSPDLACLASAGEALATAALDCVDGNAAINPAATEITGDEIDQNCDAKEVCYVDGDDDDYGSAPVVSLDLDCNDAGEGHKAGECNDVVAGINPAAVEIAGDDKDQNCDGKETCYTDGDDDDYGTTSLTSSDSDCLDVNEGHKAGDCNDANPAVNPAAAEVWYNGVDDRCDGGNDYDQDGDGKTTVASGGTDLNDLDASCSDKCNIGFYANPAAAATAGLTDYWLFNSTANEYPGFRNLNFNVVGTVYDSTTSPFTGLPTTKPAVADFDGVNDYLDVVARLITSSTYTVSVWTFMDAANPAGRSYPVDGQGSGSPFYLLVDSVDSVHLGTCGLEWNMAQGTSIQGSWVHHVWRSNGSTMTYTRNGLSGINLVLPGGGTCAPNDSPVVLGTFSGARGGSGQYFYNGKIAEYAVWNGVALSDAQVNAIYTGKKPILYTP